ncbi:MAG: hypothetical protein ACFCD0_08375 [Gemmataceae bacterium]
MALFNRIIMRVSGSIVANASVNGLRNGAGWAMGTDGPTPPVCTTGQPPATYLSERHPSQYPTEDTQTEDVADMRLDDRSLDEHRNFDEQREVLDERESAKPNSVSGNQLGCSSGVSDSRNASSWRLADMPSPAELASQVAQSLDSFGHSEFRRVSFIDSRASLSARATCCQTVLPRAQQAIHAGLPLVLLAQVSATTTQVGRWTSKHFTPSSAIRSLARERALLSGPTSLGRTIGLEMGGIGGRIPPAGATEVSGRYAAGGV